MRTDVGVFDAFIIGCLVLWSGDTLIKVGLEGFLMCVECLNVFANALGLSQSLDAFVLEIGV